ncbi:MAG: 50S ribosomal protein L17 [Planctomycetota bacterium]|nr:50S ribosomal protein L17 [Planctomycetota bacterium]
MRHLRSSNNFKRDAAHRRAMMRNLVLNLIEHGRIRTTLPKAKAARTLAEKLITLGKKGTLHHRRQAVEVLGSTVAAKRCVKKVFGELSQRFAVRPGGYTRILKLPRTIRQAKSDLPRGVTKRSKFYGTRLGDNSPLVLWELCEAEITKKEKPKGKKKKAPRAEKPKTEAAPAQTDAPKAE